MHTYTHMHILHTHTQTHTLTYTNVKREFVWGKHLNLIYTILSHGPRGVYPVNPPTPTLEPLGRGSHDVIPTKTLQRFPHF